MTNTDFPLYLTLTRDVADPRSGQRRLSKGIVYRARATLTGDDIEAFEVLPTALEGCDAEPLLVFVEEVNKVESGDAQERKP